MFKQQSASQEQVCSDSCRCCRIETEAAVQTCCLTSHSTWKMSKPVPGRVNHQSIIFFIQHSGWRTLQEKKSSHTRLGSAQSGTWHCKEFWRDAPKRWLGMKPAKANLAHEHFFPLKQNNIQVKWGASPQKSVDLRRIAQPGYFSPKRSN